MTHEANPLMTKPALRAELRRARAALSEAQWQERSLAIVEHVARYVETTTASTIALYAPMVARREVDVRPLDGWLRARGCAVAYPFMRGATFGFACVRAASELGAESSFLQPSASSRALAPGELDLAIVPALAATPSGYRLGYGAGFYDQVLGSFCPPARSLCVVFESQLKDALPVDPHDVPCDLVITERGIVSR